MNNNNLIATIIFAAVLISGSLTFAATKYLGQSDEEFEKKVFASIDAYVLKEQEKYNADTAKKNEPVAVKGDFNDDDAVEGDEDAPVTIVEFSDYECPFCAQFFTDVLPQLRENFISTGKVKLVYRDFPIESKHPDAYPAALFAECVRDQTDDEAYFKVHDEIFSTIAGGFDYEKMAEFAVGLGAKKSELKNCFDEEKFRDEIDADKKAAQEAGIDGTPGFIINNVRIPGLRDYQFYEDYIEAELAKAK